ncbi:MAG: hypothetical protein AMXMBFR33_40620 [Candidatus Xenobia bacterium]
MVDENSSAGRLIVGLGSLGTAVVAGAGEQLARLAGRNRVVCIGLDTDTAVVESLSLDVFPLVLSTPPRGVRELGRQALLKEYAQVESWLEGHLSKLPSESLYVTFVTSLAGGTGSAVLVDMAYLVRRVAQKLQPAARLELEALVPHSARPPRAESGGANAYAALTELNHFMASDTTYQIQDWESQSPPVDRVGLLSCRDLTESLDREGLPAQLTAYLALSVWPAAAPLWEAARESFQAIKGQQDEDGNPLSYFSPAASLLPVPAQLVSKALLTSLFTAAIEKWCQQLGSAPSEEEEQANLKARANEFLTKNGLVPRQVMIKLGHAAGGAQGFMKSPVVSTLFDELERRPLQGPALAAKVRELETHILQSIGSGGPDGMLGQSRHHAKQVRDHCRTALKEELKLAFTLPGFASYLSQLRNVLVDRMEGLAREVERLESEEERLGQEKERMLQEMSVPEAGLLGRVFGKKKDHSEQVPTLLKEIEAFFSNRLKLEFHRIGATVFSEVLQEVDKQHKLVDQLAGFLDELLELARGARTRALEQLSEETRLEPPDVVELLRARLGKAEVEQTSRAILKDGADVRHLPSNLPVAEAARSMLTTLEEQLGSLLEVDVVDYLCRNQPGRLAELERRARPVLQPRKNLEHYRPSEPISLCVGGKLAGFRALPAQGRQGLALLGMQTGFPLRAVELSTLHQAYLHELRQEKLSAHSRDDVAWRSLERVVEPRSKTIWLTLAQALLLGHLEPGEPLQSHRWPEMGPVRRSLARFARPEEALAEETHFLIALDYWREEKLGELGVEEYLLLLEPKDPPRSLLGQDLEPWLKAVREQLLTQREEGWPEWEQLVAECLESSPIVSEADLVAIPGGFRRWVLCRYAEQHPDQGLSFDARLGHLERPGVRASSHQP